MNAPNDLQASIRQVAELLLGEQNVALSSSTELRFGSNGSLVVNVERGIWFSHEENTGGGVLDLIAKETGLATRTEQLAWLEEHGLREQHTEPSPKSPKSQKPKIHSAYAYEDEHGHLLFEVVRYEPKGFRQRRPDGNGKWNWSVKGVRQVPFHLPQLLAADSAQVIFIVEGEKDVLALEAVGLVATCNAGGAGKWTADLSEHLVSRRVVILPDNDDPGRQHAEKVRAELIRVAAEVRVLYLPNLPPKGDVSDWLACGGTGDGLLELATASECHALTIATPVFAHSEQPAGAQGELEEGNEEKDKQSQASLLVKFVEQRFELFHDLNKDVYVRELETGEVRSLSSRQFRDCLLAGFYRETGKSPRDQAVREALGTLTGLGRFQCEQRAVHLRMAGSCGEYWIDLAEPGCSRAIRLRPGHWEVVENVEIAFVRPEPMQPLPAPIPGGSIDLLWKVANVPHGSRLLALTWLVECLRPDTPYPVAELLGEQGSAKSTTQTALRRLIDPNACDLRGAPKSIEDIFVSAGASALVSYENISHLSSQMQDALCVLATGGGFAKRKLYSDSEESVITVKRPVILNGISAAVTAQDLVDRTITIETPVITERQEVTNLWRGYEEGQGQLLGALLDIAAKALAILPDMQIPAEDRPRLIEFALLGMAVAVAVGREPADFLHEFAASRQESLSRTIDASPVAAAVVDLIEARPQGMTAPVKEILQTLEQYRPTGCDSWPKSPKGLGDALRRAAPALRQLGIDCKCLGKGSGGVVSWEVKKKPIISRAKTLHRSEPAPDKLGLGTSGTSPQDVSFDENDSEVF